MAIDILKKILEEASAQPNNTSVEPEINQYNTSMQPKIDQSNNMSIDPNAARNDETPQFLKKPKTDNASDNGSELANNLNFPDLKNLLQSFPIAKEKPQVSAGNKYLKDMYEFNNNPENVAQKSASNDFLSSMLGKKDNTPLMLDEKKLPEQSSVKSEMPTIANATAPARSLASEGSQQQPSSQQQALQQPATQSPDELKDIEFEQAQEIARKNREAANFNDLMASLSNALIGQAGMDMSKNKIAAIGRQLETADQPLTDLATKRKQYSEFLKNKEERDKNDPKHPVSVAMRDALKDMGVKIPENASYATMEKLAPQLMKNKEFQMRLKEMALRREEIQASKEVTKKEKVDARARDTAMKFQKAAQSDPTFKAARNSLDEKETLNNLLEDAYRSGGQSVQALGTRMAKFMGEKGMLSEADTKKYISNPSLFGKLSSESYLKGQGKINKKDYDNIKRLLGEIGKAQEDNLKKVYKYHAKNFSKIEKISPEQAEELINPDYQPATSSGTSNVIITPSGQEIQMASPEAAQAFKKDHPEVKIKGE